MSEVRWTIFTGPGTASDLIPQLDAVKEEARRKWEAGESIRLARLPLPLGDIVERFAKPIARVIDNATADLSPLLGFGQKYATKLAAGCSACSKRRHYLNRVVRNVRSWREWLTSWRRLRPAWRSVYGCSKPAVVRA
jgi:hypothetical protein